MGSGVTTGYSFISYSKLALKIAEGDSERLSAHTTNYLSEQMVVRSMDIKKLSAEISSLYQQRDVRISNLTLAMET